MFSVSDMILSRAEIWVLPVRPSSSESGQTHSTMHASSDTDWAAQAQYQGSLLQLNECRWLGPQAAAFPPPLGGMYDSDEGASVPVPVPVPVAASARLGNAPDHAVTINSFGGETHQFVLPGKLHHPSMTQACTIR
jgi:hypothetical protein